MECYCFVTVGSIKVIGFVSDCLVVKRFEAIVLALSVQPTPSFTLHPTLYLEAL